MLMLCIRTDKPEAELALYKDAQLLADYKWQAHKKLAESLLLEIKKLLTSNNVGYEYLRGIVVYEGPGSFTGLRIGISVANALAASLNISIAAGSGKDWQKAAITKLVNGGNQRIILPEYGSLPHITKQKR